MNDERSNAVKRWGWAPRYDEDPASVPLWFRGVRSLFWLTIVIITARWIWRHL